MQIYHFIPFVARKLVVKMVKIIMYILKQNRDISIILRIFAILP